MTQNQKVDGQEILTTAHNDYSYRLNKYAFFKTNSYETSEDLVQNTFMKTWKYLVRGGKIETMKAFLYHILDGLIIDEYRKRKTLSLDTLFKNGFDPNTEEHSRISNIFDSSKIISLIKKLPKKYRVVMHMRYVQLLSLKEISALTKQLATTVAVQVHRGLQKLRFLYTG